MNLVTIIWSMVASACLTLAAMQLLVWWKKRAVWANLLFSLMAAATAAMAFCELWMMRAETPGQFAIALRWLHIPAWVIIVSLVGFVQLQLRAGRPWLAWTVCVLRTISVLLDFMTGQNLNYHEIIYLRHIPFFGEIVSVAEGVPNPWMIVGQISLVLWVAFVTDAAITVWRRGERRQALVTGGSIVFFALSGTVQAVLVLWEIIHWPMMSSLFYMGIVAAIGYEMSRNVQRAVQLSDDLRESKEQMSLAADSSGAILWNMDMGSGRIWISEKSKAFFGFTPDTEVSLEQFLNIVHPEDREGLRQTWEETVHSGWDSSNEYRIVRPDGSIRWMFTRRRPYSAAMGPSVSMMGVSIDITERKLAEAVRRESLERYKAVVEAFDGFIYICSQDHRVEFMNKRLIERTGRNAVGELCYKALHDKDSICEWCVNERVFQDETVRWEVQSPKDGRWYYSVNTPIYHVDGTMSKQAMIMDITERKQAEETLKKSELALKNSQKDLRKLAGRLISAQEDELRRLSRELHDDLTQRLAVIAIEAGMLEIDLNKRQDAYADPIQRISQIKDQLIKVSEDVHAISRQIHPTILDDLGLVRAIESQCAAFMRRQSVEIIFRHENVPDEISDDIALCLYRIVQEGLRNIAAHSEAKNCVIFLKQNDDALFLSVSDDGIGFDPVEIRSMPGLGLSSMRERVQLIQGDFAIRSQPGEGAVITVRVPLAGGSS